MWSRNQSNIHQPILLLLGTAKIRFRGAIQLSLACVTILSMIAVWSPAPTAAQNCVIRLSGGSWTEVEQVETDGELSCSMFGDAGQVVYFDCELCTGIVITGGRWSPDEDNNVIFYESAEYEITFEYDFVPDYAPPMPGCNDAQVITNQCSELENTGGDLDFMTLWVAVEEISPAPDEFVAPTPGPTAIPVEKELLSLEDICANEDDQVEIVLEVQSVTIVDSVEANTILSTGGDEAVILFVVARVDGDNLDIGTNYEYGVEWAADAYDGDTFRNIGSVTRVMECGETVALVFVGLETDLGSPRQLGRESFEFHLDPSESVDLFTVDNELHFTGRQFDTPHDYEIVFSVSVERAAD
mgnify:CR=1 FL=1